MAPSRRTFFSLVAVSLPGAAALSAQANWTKRAPANSPGALSDHVLVHDARGALLFGGDDGNGPTGATWRFDNSGWRQLNLSVSPPARLRHAGAFFRSRNRFVVFGGSSSLTGGLRDDLWVFNGLNWQAVNVMPRLSARNDHAMCYDPKARRVLLFGGRTQSGDSNETWAWSGSRWTRIATRTSPPARRDAQMVFDQARGVAVLYGGFFGTGLNVHADTWEFDGTDWVQRTPRSSPGKRVGFGFVYDEVRARTVLFSGYAAPSQPDDTWEWDGTNWLNRGPLAKPSGRSGQAMSYSFALKRVLLYGGWDGSLNGETWIYETPQVARWALYGKACSARTAGRPQLAVVEPNLPWIGSSVEMSVRVVPTNTPVAMILGFSQNMWGAFRLPLDLTGLGAPGCTLYQAVDLITPATTNGNEARWSLPIPNNASLARQNAYVQALVVDATTNAFGAVFTQGAQLVIGRR